MMNKFVVTITPNVKLILKGESFFCCITSNPKWKCKWHTMLSGCYSDVILIEC
jgi:hypothetical protein